MRRFAIPAFMFLLAVLLIPFASAQLPVPEVTFIPDKISINSSFVMVVDPGVDDSIRVSWIGYELGAYGQVPKIGEKWVCYFSDTDTKSTCGPNPFRESNLDFSPYTFEVNTTDFAGNTNGKSMGIFIGGIKINDQVTTDISNGIAYISVWPIPGSEVTGVTYQTYYARNITTVSGKSGSLTYDVPSGAYRKDLELDLGQYYIAFSAETAGDDYGGSVVRVNMGLTEEEGYDDLGYLEIDPVSLNILIEKNQKYEKSNFKVTSRQNQTFDSMSIHIPSTTPIDVNDYIDIELDDTSLGAYGSMYFTVTLENVMNYMEIKANAQIRTNDTVIGYIPVDIKVSVKNESGTTMTTCEDKSDGSDCYGGICCDEVCRKKASCCDDDDCSSSQECEDYRCVESSGGSTADISCTTGTCYTGRSTCPTGEDWTGACREDGDDGVCCEVSVSECEGAVNGTDCDDGICCDEACTLGDCCEDIDCLPGYTCYYNYCSEAEAPTFDFTLILIIVVVVIAGVGAWYYLTKMRKGGGKEDEEFEGASEEFDEEFY